jgi:6-phosphofructokinase 1
MYGIQTVYGIQGGFHGFNQYQYTIESSTDTSKNLYQGYTNLPPIVLTNEMVEDIHHEGGTILKSARGGFNITNILQFIQTYDINQLYIIGGDGTHRAAYKIHQACYEAKLNVAVAGIPKTIDNDIDYIDRSFGFLSAVEAAQASIRSAKTGT